MLHIILSLEDRILDTYSIIFTPTKTLNFISYFLLYCTTLVYVHAIFVSYFLLIVGFRKLRELREY